MLRFKLLIYISLIIYARCNVAVYYKEEEEVDYEANNDIEEDEDNLSLSWVVISTKHMQRPKCILDERFLSFTIDIIEMMRKFRCVPLHSRKFNKLAAALAPAYLRLGGTPQDFLTFDFSGKSMYEEVRSESSETNCTPKFQNWRHISDFKLPIDYFDGIARFAKKNKLNLIFGLNGKQRNKLNEWDFESVARIVTHAKEQGYVNISWQIGNEPCRYRKYGKNETVTPLQLSSYFHRLNKLVPESKLSGPDLTKIKQRKRDFMTSFLGAKPTLHAVTYHHYFMHESEATEDKYLDVTFLDKLDFQMKTMRNIMMETEFDKDLWLGESGSSSGGGKKSLSDTFIAGFHYIGALGLAGMHCHKVFIRQSFYGGYYGMLDPITHNPLPDYWTTYIYKQLVGKIYLTEFFTRLKDVRVHAYCNKNDNNDVTLMYVNYRKSDVLFLLDEFQQFQIELFSLSAPNEDLTSKKIQLNDKILDFDTDGNFPLIRGQIIDEPIKLQKLTYGFLVIKNIRIPSCRR